MRCDSTVLLTSPVAWMAAALRLPHEIPRRIGSNGSRSSCVCVKDNAELDDVIIVSVEGPKPAAARRRWEDGRGQTRLPEGGPGYGIVRVHLMWARQVDSSWRALALKCVNRVRLCGLVWGHAEVIGVIPS